MGLDDETVDPPYTVTLRQDVDLLDIPAYSVKDDDTDGMHLYSKCLPMFDG